MSYFDDYNKYLYGEGGPANQGNRQDQKYSETMNTNSESFGQERPRGKKKRSAAPLIAACTACALGGTVIGGLTMNYFFNKDASKQLQAPAVILNQSETPNNTQKPQASNQVLSPQTTSDGKHFSIEDATRKTSSNKQSLSASDIYKKVSPSIVAISTHGIATNAFGYQGEMQGAGSGVIISNDGYIVTNNHVISGADKIEVITNDKKTFTAKLIGADPQSDIAVLKIEATELQAASFGDSSTLEVGELSVAIGNPLGELANSLTVGNISALDRTVSIDGQSLTYLQTSAAINPGNSGGALIDSFGDVIGITTAKSMGEGVEGIGFAIPINDVVNIAQQLIDNGYVKDRPYLGISPQDLDEQTAKIYGLPVGVYVAQVYDDSAAHKAGIQQGDIIIKFGDKSTETTSDLNAAKNKFKAGDSVELTVFRKGNEVQLTVVLGEQPKETQQAQDPNAQQQSPNGSQQFPNGEQQIPNGEQQNPNRYNQGQQIPQDQIPQEFKDLFPELFQ